MYCNSLLSVNRSIAVCGRDVQWRKIWWGGVSGIPELIKEGQLWYQIRGLPCNCLRCCCFLSFFCVVLLSLSLSLSLPVVASDKGWNHRDDREASVFASQWELLQWSWWRWWWNPFGHRGSSCCQVWRLQSSSKVRMITRRTNSPQFVLRIIQTVIPQVLLRCSHNVSLLIRQWQIF